MQKTWGKWERNMRYDTFDIIQRPIPRKETYMRLDFFKCVAFQFRLIHTSERDNRFLFSTNNSSANDVVSTRLRCRLAAERLFN